MENANKFKSLRWVLHSARPLLTLALLLGASNFTPLFAANPRWIYQGKDGNGITVNLTVEGGSPASVTGAIYDGNSSCAATVSNGTLSGNVLNAGVSYSAFGSPATSPMVGTLTGTLGMRSSFLTVTAFIFCNVAFVQVNATLDLVLTQIPTTAIHPPTSRLPTFILPASETMSGGYSLGTTWSASLTLTTKLQGSSYTVLGVITVDQYFGCPLVPNCTPHSELTALAFSGVLTPGVQGQLSINNAPPGSTPVFYATISPNGLSFTSLL